MKYNIKKVIKVVIACIILMSICTITFAHSGRTDANGGHKDNKNKSGLGSYHYHCGGHPAHLHPNGKCPYSSSSKSSKNTKSTKSNSSSTTKNTNVSVTSIAINEKNKKLKTGESLKLTTTILPNNATDKSVSWASSDENIATVSSTGEVEAKKSGIVSITATSTNGKKSTINLNIEEKEILTNAINNVISNKASNKINNIANNKVSNKEIISKNITNNAVMSNKRDQIDLTGISILGAIGTVGFIVYKENKKTKN